MSRTKKNGIELLLSMAVSLLLFMIIYKFIPIVFSTNDDRMIMEIVSGQYTGTPESYGIQMTYGFTWFLSRLYLLSTALNWYGIVLLGIQIFCFGIILYRVQKFAAGWKGKTVGILAAVGVYLTLWLNVFVQMTYTTTAAFVGFTALFWYGTSRMSRGSLLMTGLLANLAFCIRPNIFYMLLPMAGIMYLWQVTRKEKKSWMVYAAPFLMLAVTAMLFGVDAYAYSRDGWKEFREFFDERTEVYDYYGLLPYEKYPELYEPYGISEEEYQMMNIYDFTVLGELPKEFFPKYLKAVKQVEKERGITVITRGKNAVSTLISDVFAGGYGIRNTTVFLAALLLIIYLSFRKQWAKLIYLLAHCGAAVAMWLYFTYWGRAIERIQISMSLILLAAVLTVLWELVSGIKSGEEDAKDHSTRENRKWTVKNNQSVSMDNRSGMWKTILTCVLLVGILFAGGRNFLNYRYDNIYKTNQYTDVQLIKEFCADRPENIYFMDIATMTNLYGKFSIRNQEPAYNNYILLGDWSAYCPHFYEKLEHYGITDVKEALSRDNAYTIMLYTHQVERLQEYLGEDYDFHWAETIFGIDGEMYSVREIRRS